MSVGTTTFASGQNIANCAKMKHIPECAQEMQGVSECATSTNCPMTSDCNM